MLCNPETLYQVWFSVDRIDNTLHCKQLAPYETLKKHRTSTEQAPYVTVK